VYQSVNRVTSNNDSRWKHEISCRRFAAVVGRWNVVVGVSTFIITPFEIIIYLCSWHLFIADINMVLTETLWEQNRQ
jgi:hypothetical protein